MTDEHTSRLAALRDELTIAERRWRSDPNDPTRRKTVRVLRREILRLMRETVARSR